MFVGNSRHFSFPLSFQFSSLSFLRRQETHGLDKVIPELR
jgi:hypothetical protein